MKRLTGGFRGCAGAFPPLRQVVFDVAVVGKARLGFVDQANFDVCLGQLQAPGEAG